MEILKKKEVMFKTCSYISPVTIENMEEHSYVIEIYHKCYVIYDK